jgi:hypothetical protein
MDGQNGRFYFFYLIDCMMNFAEFVYIMRKELSVFEPLQVGRYLSGI